MSETVDLWELPTAKKIYMIAGWRQWADGGSVSSGLPEYLVERFDAREIGQLHPDGFYIFQFPGTHDLVRPVVQFNEGFPEALDVPENRFYFLENDGIGIVIFLGDEPQLDIERYVQAFLQAAMKLNVKRIIGLGGVYGEFPFDKERSLSCSYSLRSMKESMKELAVQFSNYQGGASIGSYICRRAGEKELEYCGLYAFVPMFDFSNMNQVSHRLQIEEDFMAWLAVMRRINFIFKTNLDLSDLVEKSQQEIEELKNKIEELEKLAPQLGVKEYFQRISEEFNETPFIPLDDIWEENLRRILGKFDDDEPNESQE